MTLYAIPTHRCNLNCPHCTIKDQPEDYNRDLFMEKLNSFSGKIILFGGEPTSNRERMFDVIEANRRDGRSRIGSISTNLTILDEQLIAYYKELGYVSTSWNPKRFTAEQYVRWLRNCRDLKDVNLMILITLTPDLLEMEIDNFLDQIYPWRHDLKIRFEHLISDENDRDYYKRADEWLMKLYRRWDHPAKVDLFDPKRRWYHNCNEIYTLHPDGTLYNTCPNGVSLPRRVPSECLICPRADECRPCRLQQHCSYPKGVRALIEKGVDSDE